MYLQNSKFILHPPPPHNRLDSEDILIHFLPPPPRPPYSFLHLPFSFSHFHPGPFPFSVSFPDFFFSPFYSSFLTGLKSVWQHQTCLYSWKFRIITFCADFYTLHQYKLQISNQCILTEVAVIFTANTLWDAPFFPQWIWTKQKGGKAYADWMEVTAWPVRYFIYKKTKTKRAKEKERNHN